jgi:transcriptional regulator with GAF, ATPase, and Fis domain
VLALTGGRIYGAQGAAALLGLKPSTLQSRMQRLGLTR